MTTTTDAVRLELEEIGAHEMRGRWADPPDSWDYSASHWRATLIYQGRRADFRYSQGAAWSRPPVAREVLESVLLDARLGDGANIDEVREHVAAELGEEISRKMAGALHAAAGKVRRLLGADFDRAIGDPEGFCWEVTADPPEGLDGSQPIAGREWSGRVGTHRDGYPVRVHVELRDLDGFDELSITGSTPYSGGQCLDELDGIVEPAEGFTLETIAELRRIWDRWHLNGMRAECSHQRVLGWTYNDRKALEDAGDPDAPTCPTCGYKIGSAWLREELDDDARAFLRRTFNIG